MRQGKTSLAPAESTLDLFRARRAGERIEAAMLGDVFRRMQEAVVAVDLVISGCPPSPRRCSRASSRSWKGRRDQIQFAIETQQTSIWDYLYSHCAPTPALDPPLASTPA